MDIEQLRFRILFIMQPVVEALVDYPEAVKLNAQASASSILLTIYVDDRDQGKVIGRYGKNASALRSIVNAISGRYRVRSSVEIAYSGSDHS